MACAEHLVKHWISTGETPKCPVRLIIDSYVENLGVRMQLRIWDERHEFLMNKRKYYEWKLRSYERKNIRVHSVAQIAIEEYEKKWSFNVLFAQRFKSVKIVLIAKLILSIDLLNKNCLVNLGCLLFEKIQRLRFSISLSKTEFNE